MGKLLSFSMNYFFVCKFCSNSGLETYRRTSATIPQMCITTIANLQRKTEREKDGAPRYFFSIKEIIQFMEMYWESITTTLRKQTNTWHSTILKTLQTHQNHFLMQDHSSGDFHYALVDSDLTNIKPQHEKSQKDEGSFYNYYLLYTDGFTHFFCMNIYMFSSYLILTHKKIITIESFFLFKSLFR